jgi:CHASE3 domain sensor protein
MNFTLGRKIAVGFSIALALLVLIAWASFKSLGELTQNAQRVEETYQTLQTLESILARIIDVETGERGFLISGADHYLEPYRGGARQRAPGDRDRAPPHRRQSRPAAAA